MSAVADVEAKPSLAMKRVRATFSFLLPLFVMVLLWEVVIRVFSVHPGVFPGVGAVLKAGAESIANGSLFLHIAASFARVITGTVLAVIVAVPLGILMGVSPGVSTLLTPFFAFSPCLQALRGSRLPRCGLVMALARSPL